jgi:hypothetical protein
MDTFTFLIAIVLMLIAVSYQQNWIVFGIILIMVLTQRNLGTLLLMVLGGGVLYFLASAGVNLVDYWPILVFGFIILVIALKLDKGSEPQGGMGMDPFGGMGFGMGGM